jgi:hypothetical protein
MGKVCLNNRGVCKMRRCKPESWIVAWSELGFRYAPKPNAKSSAAADPDEVARIVAHYSRDLDMDGWARDHRSVVIENTPVEAPAIIKHREEW